MSTEHLEYTSGRILLNEKLLSTDYVKQRLRRPSEDDDLYRSLFNEFSLTKNMNEELFLHYFDQLGTLIVKSKGSINPDQFCRDAVQFYSSMKGITKSPPNTIGISKYLFEVLRTNKTSLPSEKIMISFLMTFGSWTQCNSFKDSCYNLLVSRIQQCCFSLDSFSNPLSQRSLMLDKILERSVSQLGPILFLYAYQLGNTNVYSNQDYDMPRTLKNFLLYCAKSTIFLLKWSTSVLLVNYFSAADYSQRSHNFSNLLPYIIDLTYQEAGNTTIIKVFTKLCSLPLDMYPLALISKILKGAPDINKVLVEVDYVSFISNVINDYYNEEEKYIAEGTSFKLSLCLNILAHLGMVNDKNKLRISSGPASTLVSNTLVKHLEILKYMRTSECKGNIDIRIANKAIYCSTNLTFAACTILRSLSRSASLLRSQFKSDNNVQLLIEILSVNGEDLYVPYQYDSEEKLKSLILNILANLVLELNSPKRSINYSVLLGLVRGFLENGKSEELVCASLSLLRNSLFSSDEFFIQKFKENVPATLILKYSKSKNDKIKLSSLNIIRNLFACSLDVSNYIFNEFKDINQGPECKFIDFLKGELCHSQNMEIVLSLCYIISNLSVWQPVNKIFIVKNEGLMMIMKEYLAKPINQFPNTDLAWSIKSCISWIVMNVLTNGSMEESERICHVDLEDASLADPTQRAKLLISWGFLNSLGDMIHSCDDVDSKLVLNRAFVLLNTIGTTLH